ncbi:MAG: tRNA (adenosine(37)-N6)-threonylcarbamoyltransferase complex dimerization subunit type 1 TsaB [Alkalinema sp. RU_4_3]|nr:tRNA (adenosine(37)-N6)-threonylcarbamoyltransferase complex dimerization subunit type 1 TsaB [Alkalinema sp. RU_4_3]
MTYGLAIHTSSPDLGLALDDFCGHARSRHLDLGRAISNQIHSQLAQFLQPQRWEDLAFIAVAIGPGSFTGTRIGVVLARTLAQQLDIPLYGISSFAAIAQHHAPDSTLAIEMPAQRGSLFTALYQNTRAILEDGVMPPEAWQHTRQTHPDFPHHQAAPLQGKYAPELLAIAYPRYQKGDRPTWETALPYYGQHPVVF